MLVLTRRLNESLIINGNIKVTVCMIDHGKCRLAVTAPPEIVVDRQEVHERKKLDKEAARLKASILSRPVDPNIGLHCEV